MSNVINISNEEVIEDNVNTVNGLRGTAEAIAEIYEDKGAIIITYNNNGTSDSKGIIRIGTSGLTAEEIREALCTAIHYSFVFEGQ